MIKIDSHVLHITGKVGITPNEYESLTKVHHRDGEVAITVRGNMRWVGKEETKNDGTYIVFGSFKPLIVEEIKVYGIGKDTNPKE